MARGKRADPAPRSATMEESPLLTLPAELLAQVVEHLPVSDRRSLAGTCRSLQALVLSCASRLTLLLKSPFRRGASAALVAAVRRQHGALHLRLTLGQTITTHQLKGELSALGVCPVVQQLELAYIAEYDQWTRQASIAAGRNFPNLQCLELLRCAIPLPALKPLLQCSLPRGIHLRKSQLCSGTRHDSKWIMQLLSCAGLKYLAIHGSFHEAMEDKFDEALLPLMPQKEAHLSASLTHVVLNGPDIGSLQSWLDVLVHLPALEHAEVSLPGVIPSSLQGLASALPNLHTLLLPSTTVYSAQVLRTLLLHPTLRNLQLGDLKTRGGSAQAALLDITSGAIKSFRVKTISALALAYLPSFALDAMFVSIVPSQHLRIAFSPRYEAPGFLHPSTATQVDWSTVDAAIARLGPRLPQHAHMLALSIMDQKHPAPQPPYLKDLVTARLLQFVERLQPLSNWQGFGIRSLRLYWESVSCRELEAIGAALGASCQRLRIYGMSVEEVKQEARHGIPTWFPHVGNNYKLK